jgi:general secretion pathway protein C
MAVASNKRFKTVLVLATLASCALFIAQGATAVLGAKLTRSDPKASPSRSKGLSASPSIQRRRDPTIILQRNIFSSAQGDLSEVPIENPELPLDDPAEVEMPCRGKRRLIGTVVVPGDLERSLAAIVGEDGKAGLHRGGADVDGDTIRAIESDSVVLQGSVSFCRLAMFEVGSSANVAKPRRIGAKKKAKKITKGVDADRNAGLSSEEIAGGIEKVNDTNYNLSRSMLNKVLDNAGRLIGIAAVAPLMEGGRSVGMRIYGIKPNTLLTKLGIQNGDVLESVNGQPLTSPDSALGAYTTLRTADKFNLSVRRNGKSMMINYNLQ